MNSITNKSRKEKRNHESCPDATSQHASVCHIPGCFLRLLIKLQWTASLWVPTCSSPQPQQTEREGIEGRQVGCPLFNSPPIHYILLHRYLLFPIVATKLSFFFKASPKDMFIDFTEVLRGGDTVAEKHLSAASCMHPPTGTEPATYVCALTGNRTCSPFGIRDDAPII